MLHLALHEVMTLESILRLSIVLALSQVRQKLINQCMIMNQVATKIQVFNFSLRIDIESFKESTDSTIPNQTMSQIKMRYIPIILWIVIDRSLHHVPSIAEARIQGFAFGQELIFTYIELFDILITCKIHKEFLRITNRCLNHFCFIFSAHFFEAWRRQFMWSFDCQHFWDQFTWFIHVEKCTVTHVYSCHQRVPANVVDEFRKVASLQLGVLRQVYFV